MNRTMMARTLLASALALALSACGGGGGGGNTRSDAPPPSPPPASPPPPPPPPVSPPPPPQPAIDAHLALINAQGLAASGHDGSGVRIGVVDSGVNRNQPSLQGRVIANYNYLDPRANNLAVDDVVGHGTTVAQLAAGKPFGNWPGGVAQNALIVSARIIADKAPTDDGSGQGTEVHGALGLAPIHDDLIAAGVKIMNNSWGGLYWKDANATAPIAAEYRPFIQSNGGLVVFAAGNESGANPSSMAALPSQPGPGGTLPAADLERGWITVAALDTAHPSQLASYSNACGVAMRYCLVAPGTSMFTGTNDTAGNPSYWYGSGTSFAAPLVSGAAAVVWQAFPYFDNNLVRQTLLGTASDLGAPGIDATFGNGLLDVGRALKGPARLDWGDISVTLPAGTQSEWSNGLSGSGGVSVGGAGVLRLSGQSTSTGALQVRDSARVDLRGAFAADMAVVAGASASLARVVLGGSLDNRGLTQLGADEDPSAPLRIDGNVRNAGELRVGRASSVAVNGNYVQDAGGRLSWQINGPSLNVGGSAQLAGSLYVYGIYGTYVGGATRQYVITAGSGGLSGTFSSFGYDSSKLLLDATVGYDANNAWLDITRANVVAATATVFGTATPAMLSSATRVEGAFASIDAQVPGQSASGTVADGAARIQQVAGVQALRATLDSLSGRLHTLAGAASFEAIDQDRRALSQRFGEVAANPRAAGAWMRDTGGTGSGAASGRYALAGWLIGQDLRIGNAGIVGYAFGEGHAYAGIAEQGDRARNRQAQVQVYGGWSDGAAYAMAHAGSGQYQRELDRQLLLGDATFGVDSRYDGRFDSAGVEGGYRFAVGPGLGLTAYAGLQYARVDVPAFAEAGGLGFGLRSDGGTLARTQAVGGLRVGLAHGGWSFDAYAEWLQPLVQSGGTLQASFTGIDAWSALPSLQDRAAALLGVSAQAWLSPKTRLSLGLDQRLGSEPGHAWSLRYVAGF